MQSIDAKLVAKYWLNFGGMDTPFLYLRRARVVLRQLNTAYALGDRAGMDAWWQVLEQGSKLLPKGERHEKFLCAAESMLCLGLLDIVISSMEARQTNAAYGGLERVRDIMEKRGQRRSEQGLPVLDDMEVELAFLRTLAIVKLHGPEDESDRLISVAELRQALNPDLLPRMRRYYAKHPPQEPYVDMAIGDQLNWSWVMLLRLLLRFDLVAAAEEIDAFNDIHADFLTIRPGFYRSGIREEGTSVYFWDMEIAKLWLFNELHPLELEMLNDRRMKAFEDSGARHPDNYWMRTFLLRETEMMRQGRRPG